MNEPIYNISDIESGFPYGMLVFLLTGIGFLVCGTFFGREEAEYDGQSVLVKDLPMWSRIIIQGIPTLIGLIFIAFSCISVINYHNFFEECKTCDYMELCGVIEDVNIERADTRTEEQYEITFRIEDTTFETANTYSYDQMLFFSEGTNMLIHYSYVKGEMVVLRVYLVN